MKESCCHNTGLASLNLIMMNNNWQIIDDHQGCSTWYLYGGAENDGRENDGSENDRPSYIKMTVLNMQGHLKMTDLKIMNLKLHANQSGSQEHTPCFRKKHPLI